MGTIMMRRGADDTNTKTRSERVELAWIWSVVGYTVLRFAIAWGAFSDHGANVWIFGLLDVGTAWPYAKAVAAICRRAAASEWRRLWAPITLALTSFFAPYAYLWFAAGEMPPGLRIGLSICVAVLAVAATLGTVAKSRRLRRQGEQRQKPVATGDASPTPHGEVVIDLRGDRAKLILARSDAQ